MSTDRDRVIAALEAAQLILAEYIEPGGPAAELTVSRLLAVLDNDDLDAALERFKAGYGLHVVK